MSSLKKPSSNVSSFTVIPFNGDLHSLRDHPSLFCTLRFSMAIFLSISEQKNAHKILFPPSLCHYMVEAVLPGDPNPAPLHTLKQPDIPSPLPLPPVQSHVSQPSTQLRERAAHQQMSCLPRATKQQSISHISPGVLGPVLPLNSVTSQAPGKHPRQGHTQAPTHTQTLKHACGDEQNSTHSHTDCAAPGQLLFVLIDWRGLEGTQPKNAVSNAPAAIA